MSAAELVSPLIGVAEERSAQQLPPPSPHAAVHGHRPSMPLEDAIFMSPWQKWKVHRHPPLKMVLHVLLIAVATPTIMFAEWQKVSFLHDLRLELVRLYLPDRCRPECLDDSTAGGSRYCKLPPYCTFSLVEDVTSFVEGVVEGYYTSRARLVPRIDYIRPRGTGTPPEPVHMHVHYLPPILNKSEPEELLGHHHYDLKPGGLEARLGPLGGLPSRNISQREVFDQLGSLHLRLHFLSTECARLPGPPAALTPLPLALPPPPLASPGQRGPRLS